MPDLCFYSQHVRRFVKILTPKTLPNMQRLFHIVFNISGFCADLTQPCRIMKMCIRDSVAIARTLALNPDIILFDEPMSALDADTRLTLRQELKNIQNKFGSTMIYITHDQEEAFAMSDRIMVLSEGKIQQIDTPRNIIDHPANEYIQRFVIHNIQLKIDSLIQFARAKV